MNLLALSNCKKEAEQMAQDPQAWLGLFRIGPAAERIRDQGTRTLEVVAEIERLRKRRTPNAA